MIHFTDRSIIKDSRTGFIDTILDLHHPNGNANGFTKYLCKAFPEALYGWPATGEAPYRVPAIQLCDFDKESIAKALNSVKLIDNILEYQGMPVSEVGMVTPFDNMSEAIQWVVDMDIDEHQQLIKIHIYYDQDHKEKHGITD